ncbi:MAG: CocE/NonD family hydrolase [Chloroflexi bacterium]|nr:CocE/NonD family hydrolase [Chloroflexota bacterium]
MPQVSQPIYKIKVEKNVYVTMRDGVRLAVDVYRPDVPGKFPALLAMSAYGKDLQVLPQQLQPRAEGSLLWDGTIEAGDPEYLVPRGYVHVIGDVRGSGDSEGQHVGQTDPEEARDGYEMVEWIAQQPWCDGNVGMIGISYYAGLQCRVAIEQPPHLKAIFPFEVHVDVDPTGVVNPGAYRIYTGRPMDPGPNNGSGMAPINYVSAVEKRLSRDEFERLWQERLNDPDLKQYSIYWSCLRYPYKNPIFADVLLTASCNDDKYRQIRPMPLDKIRIPVYTGGPWSHDWASQAFDCFNGVGGAKKCLMVAPGTIDRPWRTQHEEMIRWFDYWLKGIDTGIMKEPPIKMFIPGANKWRYEQEWPLTRTKWTKFYLRSWKRLLEEPPTEDEGPDCYVQEPPSVTADVKSVKYTTPPFPQDTEITGPLAVHFYAAIDQDDTNWNVKLREMDEHGNEIVHLPGTQPHLTDNWLKASFRALDEAKSKPGRPWHANKKQPVRPGAIYEYALSIGDLSKVIKSGHRLQMEICSMDNVPGYMHVCSSKTVLHKIYHDKEHPSYLLLPVIPE